jgi:hypothetical protein
MEYTVTITNKKIFEFYEENKSLDIETTNLLFIEILDKLLRDTRTDMNDTISRQILDTMKSMNKHINSFQDSFSKLQNDVNMNFVLKFNEFKRDYLEELKMILTNTTNTSAEKLSSVIEKYNDILQDKTKIIINELDVKNKEFLIKEIMISMKGLQDTINQDTSTLLKQQVNKDTLDSFITSVEDKFSKSLLSSQNIFNTLISSTEQRLTSRLCDVNTESSKKIDEIKDISISNSSIQTQLHTNLGELLKKMENSSAKGRVSENILINVLNSLYPIAEIDYVGGQKESGDIFLIRKGKTTILFENKNYDYNVGKTEVDKFIRDIDIQNCNGILLSQKSAIVNRDNYEIKIHNGKVLIFIHNVEYNSDKIKIAVDIIDYLQESLSTINEMSDETEKVNIEKHILDEINKEFQEFSVNKLNHIKTIKEYNTKLLNQIDNFKFPCMENILSKNYSNSLSSKEHVCEFCNYVAKNPRALTAHKRGCENKKKNSLET